MNNITHLWWPPPSSPALLISRITNPFSVQNEHTSPSWPTLLLAGLAAYAALCRALRHRREHAMRRAFGFTDRASLARMTADEAQRIIYYIQVYDIPMFHVLSLEFGMFKTYAVERMSKLLLATGNLTDPIKSRKRYEDTAVLIAEFALHPPSSPRALRAIARMNYLHSIYQKRGQICNEDLLYTLSVFVTEPRRFARLYEWRALNDVEVCAYGVFWKSVGDAMGINYEELARGREGRGWKDGLEFVEDITSWAKDYEVRKMRPSTVAAKPARALLPLLTYWVPWFAKGFAEECACVLMGDRVREAFMLPEPGIGAAAIVYAALVVRRFVLKHLCLPRVFEANRLRDPDPATGRMHLNYTYGNYPFYLKPTFWNRWGPEAWAVWLAGGKLPGDDPEEFMPQGYTVGEMGPRDKANQGLEEMQENVEELMRAGRGGCPFI
ncbi:hypothetical protein DL765_000613 [Monosporascus sp. GIB2]|nr:hypothetical protein DL765_000613 [Monosporascus sp. GIB2]